MSLYKIQKSGHKKRHKSYMNEALLEAQKGCMFYRHGAVIVKHGKIIGRGHNYQTSRQHHNFGSKFSVHAEIDALNSVSNRHDLKGATMYVVRWLNTFDGENVLGNSLPCRQCLIKINKFMTKYGFSGVYYSNGNFNGTPIPK